MTLMFVLAPSTRFGYFIYPATLAIWLVGRRGRASDGRQMTGSRQIPMSVLPARVPAGPPVPRRGQRHDVAHRLRVVLALPGLAEVAQRLHVGSPGPPASRGPRRPGRPRGSPGRPPWPPCGRRRPPAPASSPSATMSATRSPNASRTSSDRARSVLHHVVQDGGAQHVRVGDTGAAHQDLERLEQVLERTAHPVGRRWSPWIAERELHRLRHRVAGGCGQQAAQLGFRPLPGVPVREELHLVSVPHSARAAVSGGAPESPPLRLQWGPCAFDCLPCSSEGATRGTRPPVRRLGQRRGPRGGAKTPRVRRTMPPFGTTCTAAAGAAARARAAGRGARACSDAAGAGRRGGRSAWWWLPGWVFAAVTQAPALLAVAWLVPGIGMLLAGRLLPLPMVIIFVPLAVALCYFAMRRLPVSWPRGIGTRCEAAACRARRACGGRCRPARGARPWSSIAAGFGVWQAVFRSEQLFVASDPGVYLQYGYWIAGHGTARIPASAAAFGGAGRAELRDARGSPCRAGSITPAFLPGLPLVLAGGDLARRARRRAADAGGARRLRRAVVRRPRGAAVRGVVGGGRGTRARGAACPRCTCRGRRSASRWCRCCCSAGCACSLDSLVVRPGVGGPRARQAAGAASWRWPGSAGSRSG